MILYQAIFQIPLLLFSITIHEYFHGLIAEKKGDDTARMLGRLTLNPFAHIDLFGTVLLPLVSILFGMPVFGWAKPVPVNQRNLYSPRKDMLFIGIAGPLANFFLALCAGIALWFINPNKFFYYSDIFAALIMMLRYLVIINTVLGVFNLIPVPPLDGSHILAGLLPHELANEYEKLTPFGFLILVILISTGILWRFLGPVVNFLIKLLGGGYV